MRPFGFYFFATLLYIGCAISVDIPSYPDSIANYVLYADLTCLGLTLGAPLVMVRRFEGSTRLHRLFMTGAIAPWLLLLVLVGTQMLPLLGNGYARFWRYRTYTDPATFIVAVVMVIGLILFTIACFLVQAPPLKKGLRAQAWMLIVLTIATILVMITGFRQIVPPNFWRALTIVVDVLLPFPLLLLNYRLWRQAPARQDLAEAVAALGSGD
jgi:hypothetical protein